MFMHVGLSLGARRQYADAELDDYGMPRGMGHLRGGVEHVERLHIPWHGSSVTLAEESEIHPRPNRRDEPVYFRPHEQSEFSTREIENGVEATWRGLTNGEEVFADDRLTIAAWVEPGTGHVAFKASAASPERGVFGVQVPIANLHADHDFIIPSFSGIMVNRRMTTGLKTFDGLRNFLEARVVGIKGRDGSVGLWAQDDLFYNHYLFFHWSGRAFSLAFEHLNLMPIEDHDRPESVVYYLDVFDGGWVDAMTPYRDWYRERFAEEMKLRASTEWADRIRIIIDSFAKDDSEMLARVAEMFEPDTVLFHEWNARAPGFDTELPDWTPREGYADRVRAIQEHGFRTMAYVNTYCVNYNSPVFQRDNIAEFGLTRKRNWYLRGTERKAGRRPRPTPRRSPPISCSFKAKWSRVATATSAMTRNRESTSSPTWAWILAWTLKSLTGEYGRCPTSAGRASPEWSRYAGPAARKK